MPITYLFLYAFGLGIAFAILKIIADYYDWDDDTRLPLYIFGTLFFPLVLPFALGFLFINLILKL